MSRLRSRSGIRASLDSIVHVVRVQYRDPGRQERRDEQEVEGVFTEQQSLRREHRGQFEQPSPERVRPLSHLLVARRPDADESVPFGVGEQHAAVVEQARDADENESREVELVAEIERDDPGMDDTPRDRKQ